MKYTILFLAIVLLLPFANLADSHVQADVEVIPVLVPSFTTVNAVVTAYTASADETDGSPLVTASGSPTVKGVVACPRSLQFGTKVEIGGSMYTCLDRMNPRYSGQYFDILVDTKNQAFKWGRKHITIKVYN